MRTAMYFNLPYLTDQDAADLASYLARLFGPDSVLTKSPVDMPGYKETVRPFSSDAMNIVYVEYDMPGPSRMPFSAAPAKDGNIWIPNFGVANKITRLDPKTGEMQDFSVPNVGTAAIHSAVPAADGSVWLAEQGSDKLGRWDPTTQKAAGESAAASFISPPAFTAGETGAAATQVLASADQLGKQAETLRGDVDQFLADIRAA